MFGAMPPMALTKDLLVRMLTYRIQEETFGGLDRATIRLLDGIARGEKPGTEPKRCVACEGTGEVRRVQLPDLYLDGSPTF